MQWSEFIYILFFYFTIVLIIKALKNRDIEKKEKSISSHMINVDEITNHD